MYQPGWKWPHPFNDLSFAQSVPTIRLHNTPSYRLNTYRYFFQPTVCRQSAIHEHVLHTHKSETELTAGVLRRRKNQKHTVTPLPTFWLHPFLVWCPFPYIRRFRETFHESFPDCALFFFLFFLLSEHQLARTNSTLYARIRPQGFSKLRTSLP